MMDGQIKIPCFRDDAQGITFNGAYVFSAGGRNMLLNQYGYTAIIDDSLLKQLKKQEITEELAMFLIQHRFVSMDDIEFSVVQTDKTIHPVFFMIDLTNRCNMACKYCLRDGDDSPSAKVMTSEMVGKICEYILNYCKEHNEEQITIQPWGGEPLLEKDKIFQIQDFLRGAGIDPCITIETNGLLLSDQLIEELKNRNIWTSVSIDGPSHIHNAQRVFRNGSPTHSAVEKNLIKLRDAYDGRVSVIATVTKETYSSIDEIIRYLVTDLKLRSIKVNFVHKSSFVDNTELCLTSDEIGAAAVRILKTLKELSAEGYEVSDYNIYTKIMNVLFNLKTDVCICDGCHGGRRMITFDYQGNVFPCDVTDYPEECLGNISEEPDLVKLVEKNIDVKPYFRQKIQPECEDCPWYCYCRGGCTVHVKTQGDQPPCVDEIECAVNKALYPELVKLILEEPSVVNRLLQTEVL